MVIYLVHFGKCREHIRTKNSHSLLNLKNLQKSFDLGKSDITPIFQSLYNDEANNLLCTKEQLDIDFIQEKNMFLNRVGRQKYAVIYFERK